MPCPRCDSRDLWDDNLWWGCNVCGFAANDEGGTMLLAADLLGLPRTVAEVEQRAGWTRADYLPRLVPSAVCSCDLTLTLDEHSSGRCACCGLQLPGQRIF